MSKSVLIANRGEIAIRIARTVRETGFTPLGIYTEQDVNALHRKFMAEDAKVSSYLDIKSIVEAAVKLGADAVHPGYGFLSENPEFAKSIVENGIVFIGPPPDVMALSGDKVAAKKAAVEAGVSTLPYTIAKKPDDVVEFAREHGYPVLIKAVGGGGGTGMRLVRSESEVEKLFEQARKEAEKAFGDPRLYVEPYIEYAKHIEVQILGDGDRAVHLYERDCSIQRRYQKVVEEAPAPTLTPEARRRILEDAVKLAEHLNYVNAGTFEFIYDVKRNRHYFMEINARLQVEHPVTEMVTGIDIVREQLVIGFEGVLGLKQEDVVLRGHSIEVRINAENPLTMLPSPGVIKAYREPGGPGVRVDSGVDAGVEVSAEYTPLIGKLVVWAPTRIEALKKLERALSEYVIVGVQTNIPLLKAIIEHTVFREGVHTTRFFADYWSDLEKRIREREALEAALVLAAAVKSGGKLRERLIAGKTYAAYTNGLFDNRIAAVKRRAWAYWARLRSRVRKYPQR